MEHLLPRWGKSCKGIQSPSSRIARWLTPRKARPPAWTTRLRPGCTRAPCVGRLPRSRSSSAEGFTRTEQANDMLLLELERCRMALEDRMAQQRSTELESPSLLEHGLARSPSSSSGTKARHRSSSSRCIPSVSEALSFRSPLPEELPLLETSSLALKFRLAPRAQLAANRRNALGRSQPSKWPRRPLSIDSSVEQGWCSASPLGDIEQTRNKSMTVSFHSPSSISTCTPSSYSSSLDRTESMDTALTSPDETFQHACFEICHKNNHRMREAQALLKEMLSQRPRSERHRWSRREARSPRGPEQRELCFLRGSHLRDTRQPAPPEVEPVKEFSSDDITFCQLLAAALAEPMASPVGALQERAEGCDHSFRASLPALLPEGKEQAGEASGLPVQGRLESALAGHAPEQGAEMPAAALPWLSSDLQTLRPTVQHRNFKDVMAERVAKQSCSQSLVIER